MMKVICIGDDFGVTVGKWYECKHRSGNLLAYLIKGDEGQALFYPKSLFMTREEYRDQMIKSIL